MLVSPGHEGSFFTSLQRVKVVRLEPETAGQMQWMPDAAAAAKQAISIVQEPCHGHLAALTYRLKKAGFRPFNR